VSVRVAAVLACHNRVDKTLAALRALQAQEGVDDVLLAVHLLDDASTDGTPERVAEEFPKVSILHGSGQLFWNGGMRRAFAAALAEDHDHYLWLNDDTILDPGALATLLATYRQLAERATRPLLVAGSTRDPVTGALTYGGVTRPHRVRPLRFELLEPLDVPRPCETMNGNSVLVPRAVARRVGNLDPAYRHGMGDYDYGLRARAAGCEVWITPGTIATCPTNPLPAVGERPLREEWRRLRSTKELPLSDWQVFARRWAGPLWPLYWLSPYARRGVALLRQRL
jgi:GT2 family glycosyltransferase